MYKKLFCIFMFLTFVLTPIQASETKTGVRIEVVEQQYTSAGVLLDVSISFGDTALYNEQVYFSYHLVSENGEMLRFENERLPISLQQDGTADIDIQIDCAQFLELEGHQTAWIQFDLVDQQNVYWFRDRGLVAGEGAQVLFDRSLLAQIEPEQVPPADSSAEPVQDAQPRVEIISVILNAAAWAILIVCLCWAGRRKARRRPTNSKEGV